MIGGQSQTCRRYEPTLRDLQVRKKSSESEIEVEVGRFEKGGIQLLGNQDRAIVWLTLHLLTTLWQYSRGWWAHTVETPGFPTLHCQQKMVQSYRKKGFTCFTTCTYICVSCRSASIPVLLQVESQPTSSWIVSRN